MALAGMASSAAATAFSYSGGTYTIINPPGVDSNASRINDLGEIAGTFFDPSSYASKGFVDNGGVFYSHWLPQPPSVFLRQGLNNSGTVRVL